MDHPKRRKSDKQLPRVERTEEGELIVLQSVRATLRLMGVVLFFLLTVVAGGAVVMSQLANEAHDAKLAADEARDAAYDARVTAASTQRFLEEAISTTRDPSPPIAEALAAVDRIEAMLEKEFGDG